MHDLHILTTRYPFPPYGGDVARIHNFITTLKRRGVKIVLHVVTFDPPASDQIVKPDENLVVKIHKINRLVSVLWALCFAALGKPLQVGLYFRPSLLRKLKLETRNASLLFHLVRTAGYLPLVEGSKTARIDLTDALSLNYSSKFHGVKIPYRLALFFDRLALSRFERKVTNIIPSSVISQRDADYLQKRRSGPVSVIPNLQVTYKRRLLSPSAKDILFIGNCRSQRNKEALLYFAEQVMPKLSPKSDVTLVVLGYADERLRRAAFSKYENIKFYGAVGDFSQYVTTVRLAVAPMLGGAGLQNKIMEYLSLSIPVVSTKVALAGINKSIAECCLSVDAIENFADACIELYSNYSELLEMSNNGYFAVTIHHDNALIEQAIWDFVIG